MKIICRLLCGLAFVIGGFACAETANARDIYAAPVADGGRDSNQGRSAANPTTWKKAFRLLENDCTIILAPGTYRLGINQGGLIEGKENVTVRTSSGRAMIVGNGQYKERNNVANSGIAIYESRNVTIMNLDFRKIQWDGVSVNARRGFFTSGTPAEILTKRNAARRKTRNIKIMNVTTRDTGRSGMYLANVQGLNVIGCKVSRYIVGGGTGQEGMTLSYCNNFKVRGCTVFDKNAGPGDADIAFNARQGSSNGTIYDSSIYDNSGRGFYTTGTGIFADGHSITFHSNMASNCNSAFSVGNEEGPPNCRGYRTYNIAIVNNFAVNNRSLGLGITPNIADGERCWKVENVLFAFNTVVNNRGGGVKINNPDAKNIVVAHNIITNNARNQILVQAKPVFNKTLNPAREVRAFGNLVSGARASKAFSNGGSNFSGNPNFVNGGDLTIAQIRNNFKIQSGSAAANRVPAATAEATVRSALSGSSFQTKVINFLKKDGGGQNRRGSYDVGADEI